MNNVDPNEPQRSKAEIPVSLLERIGILIGAAVFRTLVAGVGATIVAAVWIFPFAVLDRYTTFITPAWAWTTMVHAWTIIFAVAWVFPGLTNLLLAWVFGDSTKV